MASINQIAAMKIEAINTGGRKKDWWDIHELLSKNSLEEILELHKKWEPWTHNKEQLLQKLIIFDEADKEPNPKCIKEKDWDIIKMDIIKQVEIIKTPRQQKNPTFQNKP
jgi:hypothetical protein